MPLAAFDLLGVRVAGQGVGGRVDVPRVAHRPDQGAAVEDAGGAGQVLADLHAGSPGGDRLERPAHLCWCLRLQIKGVEVAGSAGEEDKNNRPRLVAAQAVAPVGGGQGAAGQQGGQPEPQQAGVANLHQLTPGDADAMPVADGGKHHSLQVHSLGKYQAAAQSTS